MTVGAIAGIMSRDEAPRATTVETMLRAAPHRGHDVSTEALGRSIVGITAGSAGLAHLGRYEGWACALLGPLDNVSELAADLGLDADNPAAVVAAAFDRWQVDTVSRLRGSFAGMVTDGDRLWTFRDHIGGRPLFYRDDGRTWWGATEAKQVVAGAGIPRRPNIDAITRTYYRGVTEESALDGVQRLMYGSVLAVDRSGSRSSRHWDPPASLLESAPLTLEDAREQLVVVLETAISRSVHGADVIALSGGIDSPVVAAFSAPRHLQLSGRPIGAYTFIYPDQPTTDESKYTRLVAESLGIELSEVVPTAGPLDEIERWVTLADGPWDSLPMAVAAQGYQRARELGGTQILTGTLAEYVYTVNPFVLGHLASHARFSALADQLRIRRAGGRTWPSLTKQIARELTPAPAGRFYAWARRRRSAFAPPWTDPIAMGAARYPSALRNPMRRRWELPTLQSTKGTTTTSEAIEACAASLGLTVRNPLADRDLWEFFLKLPVEIKFPDTTPKSLVRQAMRGRLPDEILDRRDKTVFDENVLATVPWDTLDRYLGDPPERLAGIDYGLLAERLSERNVHPVELVWAYDLCAVHAFLETF
jgi:asparagine synthase (glutamine-hydrolysing)